MERKKKKNGKTNQSCCNKSIPIIVRWECWFRKKKGVFFWVGNWKLKRNGGIFWFLLCRYTNFLVECVLEK